VDAFWVGTRLGSEGLAAVSTSLFWIWMMIALAEMIGVGLTAVAARRHGEGRPTDAAGVAGDALIFTLGIGIAVAAIGLVALRSLRDGSDSHDQAKVAARPPPATELHHCRLPCRTADRRHRHRVQHYLYRRHANGDAVWNAGPRRARHRAPCGELAVHGGRRLRRGDGGYRWPEPRCRAAEARRARGVARGRFLLGARPRRLCRGLVIRGAARATIHE